MPYLQHPNRIVRALNARYHLRLQINTSRFSIYKLKQPNPAAGGVLHTLMGVMRGYPLPLVLFRVAVISLRHQAEDEVRLRDDKVSGVGVKTPNLESRRE